MPIKTTELIRTSQSWDGAITPGLTTATLDISIAVPDDVLDGDYHFMLRLTDRAGWQTIKAVPIHLKNQTL